MNMIKQIVGTGIAIKMDYLEQIGQQMPNPLTRNGF